MRKLAAALVVGTLGCNTPVSTPTTPSAATVELSSPGASLCASPEAWRTYTVPVPGGQTAITVWIVSITPATGATLRAGDGYMLSSKHATPRGVTAFVQFSLGGAEQPFGPLLVVSGGGCGAGTFRAQVPAGVTSPRLMVRIWAVPGDVPAGSPPSAPARPPDFEASEPLDWTVQ